MKIGVQGGIGSACDAAALSCQEQRFPEAELIYLVDAAHTLAALENGEIDAAMLAAEVYGLKVLDVKLPSNDGYVTRFVLVKKAAEQ